MSNNNQQQQPDTQNKDENWTQRYVDYDKEEPQPRDISNDYIKEEMVGNVRGVFIKTRNLDDIETFGSSNDVSSDQNLSSNDNNSNMNRNSNFIPQNVGLGVNTSSDQNVTSSSNFTPQHLGTSNTNFTTGHSGSGSNFNPNPNIGISGGNKNLSSDDRSNFNPGSSNFQPKQSLNTTDNDKILWSSHEKSNDIQGGDNKIVKDSTLGHDAKKVEAGRNDLNRNNNQTSNTNTNTSTSTSTNTSTSTTNNDNNRNVAGSKNFNNLDEPQRIK